MQKIKVVQPVKTRWNSNALMVQSLLMLQPALEHILFNSTNENLVRCIPDVEQFNILEDLFPFLLMIKTMSESWSVDTSPTMHLIHSEMTNMLLRLEDLIKEDRAPCIAPVITRFRDEFNHRVKNKGMDNLYFVYGAILNPYYRGVSLKYGLSMQERRETGRNLLQESIDLMIENHPTTREFREKGPAVDKPPTPKKKTDAVRDYLEEEEGFAAGPANPDPLIATHPPIKRELDRLEIRMLDIIFCFWFQNY